MRRWSAIPVALWLAACATTAPPPIPLEGIPATFRMAGRLSVAQQGSGEIVRLSWDRRPASDTWIVLSPVGSELARIERGERGVQVLRQGEPPLAAASLGDVTSALLGVAIDERLLLAWLHGRPASGPGGWEVVIEPAADGSGVARRVTAASGETTLRLVVDRYEVLSP